jgi:metal-sulfur cluster biosynthetic enzyme
VIASPDIQEDDVLEALSQVIDPEIGLDIVTLGLVYGVRIDEDVVTVIYSLTTRGCPMESIITNGIVATVSALPGVDRVAPQLVWEPRWSPAMIREGA